MPVPLDKMMEVTGSTGTPQPALHAGRIERMVFVRYSAPPTNMDDRAEYDAWMERVNYLCDDLHWLLQLLHDKFWCQAVFDEGLHKALDSFLRCCPRSSDALENLPEGGKQKQLELCRLVFMTYLRMATYKESKDHFITPEVFGEILYENFLFDVPKILDICSLFGKSNGPLLNKMIGNIFTQQPKYMDDLRETMPTILQVFNNIAAKCGVQLETSGHSPQKLDGGSHRSGHVSMRPSDLQDVLYYLSDTAITLHRFLDVYPPACTVLHQFHLSSVIANFYEAVIPELTETLKQQELSLSMKKQLTSKLHQAKKSLLTVFHCIVHFTCLQPVLENGSNEEVVTGCIEDFLHTMTSVLGERRFLAAYEGMFSFQDDVDLLLQASSCIDVSQFEYIQSAINSAFSTFGHRKSPRGDTNTGGRTSPDGAPDSSSSGATSGKVGGAGVKGSEKWGGARPKMRDTVPVQDDFQTEDYDEGAVSCPRPSDVEIVSLITSVKDLLPHLGEGFIELALEELDWNQERVVSCILEDKLPQSLQDISVDLPRQEREVNEGDGQTDYTDVLESRKNIFDNDEFDVFKNKNVDLSRAHVGKKEEKVDLDDKSTVKAVRATYDAYGSIDQSSSIYDSLPGGAFENDQMYDDEYDDTYDSNAVGADDADSADELTNKTVLPRVLLDLERKKAKAEGRAQEESGDEEEEEDGKGDQPPKDDFVYDPAKLREQAEQRRQSQGQRGRGGSRGRGGGGPPRNRDVKGNPKGQGQSSEVQRNRQLKEKHKGSRNRNNADKKMSKGMF